MYSGIILSLIFCGLLAIIFFSVTLVFVGEGVEFGWYRSIVGATVGFGVSALVLTAFIVITASSLRHLTFDPNKYNIEKLAIDNNAYRIEECTKYSTKPKLEMIELYGKQYWVYTSYYSKVQQEQNRYAPYDDYMWQNYES